MSLAPLYILDGNNALQAVGVNQAQINGKTLNVEAIGVADPVSGATASVTAPGANGTNALAIQGVLNGQPVPVSTTNNGSTSATITQVIVGPSSTQLLPVNTVRLGLMLFNEATAGVVFIAYGGAADSVNSYSFQLGPGEKWIDDTLPFRGAIYATTGAGNPSSTVRITELLP